MNMDMKGFKRLLSPPLKVPHNNFFFKSNAHIFAQWVTMNMKQ